MRMEEKEVPEVQNEGGETGVVRMAAVEGRGGLERRLQRGGHRGVAVGLQQAGERGREGGVRQQRPAAHQIAEPHQQQMHFCAEALGRVCWQPSRAATTATAQQRTALRQRGEQVVSGKMRHQEGKHCHHSAGRRSGESVRLPVDAPFHLWAPPRSPLFPLLLFLSAGVVLQAQHPTSRCKGALVLLVAIFVDFFLRFPSIFNDIQIISGHVIE